MDIKLKAALAIVATVAAVQGAKAIFPIESHTSDIPAGTPENIASACSASTGSSFGFLGLELYKSTHTRLDANCVGAVKVAEQLACAEADGVSEPSSVLLAAGGYCPSGL